MEGSTAPAAVYDDPLALARYPVQRLSKRLPHFAGGHAPFHERCRGKIADLDQVSSHRIRRDPDPPPDLAERETLSSEPSDLLDVVNRERRA